MGLLLSLSVMNYIDRTIINILAEPIKDDLGLADWQIGMMSGLAFALFYATAGVPIARLAERYSRPLIIGLSIGVWSLFTTLCGLSTNFIQLVLARIGVGVGEAGCFPASHALISDYVTRAKRASALAFFSLGTPIGSLLGKSFGGIFSDLYGWRAAFLLAGLPGLVLAVLSIFTLPEPRKRLREAQTDAQAAAVPPPAKWGEALKILRTKRTFWLMASAHALKIFISNGQAPFAASFFLRNHKAQIAELAAPFGLGAVGFMGVGLGLSMGVLGILGTWLGGQVSDRFGAKDSRTLMLLPATVGVFMAGILCVAFTTENAALGLLLIGLNSGLGAMTLAPVFATTQGLVPPRIRPTATAMLFLIVNLVGMGLGPIGVGLLSDALAGPGGLGSAEGIRWALIASTLMGLVATGLYLLARRTITSEMES